MKLRRRDFDIFSLSFLDIISCGFGAVVLLVLISKFSQAPETATETAAVAAILDQVLVAERQVDALQDALSSANENVGSKQLLLDTLRQQILRTEKKIDDAKKRQSSLSSDIAGLTVVQQSLDRAKQASVSAGTREARDAEAGGIPVDSDYVVFIVDTSGSMREIWNRVTRELENVIRIHPKLKGFQVLNDNGQHLLSAYEGRWIPDSPRRRESVIKLFRTWQSASNSSPVEGLEVALKRYTNATDKVSIYIFGDDYSGGSYDPVINALVTLNTDRIRGTRRARVHAVGFLSNYSTARFATLMREVTQRNGGTFIALPK